MLEQWNDKKKKDEGFRSLPMGWMRAKSQKFSNVDDYTSMSSHRYIDF